VLQEIDLADNKDILVQANYGEREASLVKTMRKTLQLSIVRIDYVYWGTVAALAAVIILLIIIIRRKKCKHCKHKNWPWKKICSKCGEKFD
jgi:hypothetical protein